MTPFRWIVHVIFEVTNELINIRPENTRRPTELRASVKISPQISSCIRHSDNGLCLAVRRILIIHLHLGLAIAV